MAKILFVSKHYMTLVCFVMFLNCSTRTNIPDFSPEESLLSFEIADGFQIELIAHEPLISDPVAMEIDEFGRMYVVQMHGYPLNKSGSGSVRQLSDSDGDGVMDRSVTYAEDLILPNGIMRWKNGILVTDAPYLLYFEDEDDDGRADIRDTLLTGFALSNPQHKVNTPMYGLDNWIYLANERATTATIYVNEFGDKGEEVKFYNRDNSPILLQNANGRRVRLRPDKTALEMMSSATQYSQTQDVWGRHFLGNNTNHIFHEVISANYLGRNKDLVVPSSINSVSGYGMPADVYPITENPEHQIFTNIGVFTSACGVTSYGGGLFPDSFNQVAFIAEPVSNIVHACKVEEAGVSFKATRLYKEKEFLASRDPWFRPVNHYIGPDGALYVIDYHRRYIEHPEWMGEDVVQSGAMYDGNDKGRIYRITPTGTPAATWTQGLDLGDATDSELIQYLGHPNAWYRRNAQRLLVDRQNKTTVVELKKVVQSDTSAFARLHASWTLEGLGALTGETVITLLNDQISGVRENGVLLSEFLINESPELIPHLLSLKDDDNTRVRFQLLCTLGNIDTPEAQQVREYLLFKNIDDSWMQIAAMSAKQPDYLGLLRNTIKQFDSGNNSYTLLVKRITAMYAAQSEIIELKALINQALDDTNDQTDGIWQAAVLSGIAQGDTAVDFANEKFHPEREKLVKSVFNHRFPLVRASSLDLLKQLGIPEGTHTKKAIDQCYSLLKEHEGSVSERVNALEFLSINNSQSHQKLFYSLLSPKEHLDIQKTSINILGKTDGLEFVRYLTDNWQQIPPKLRDEAIGIFLVTEEKASVLIEALEEKVIDPSSLNFYRQVHMMTLANEDLRKRSRQLFSNESKDEDRKKVIEEYKEVLDLKGNSDRGKIIFEKNCSSCHQIGGENGIAYGPDLGTIRNRRAESILTDILDPSLSIADGYDLWEIELTDGESKQGIISSETPTTIALRIYGREEEVISRQAIESMRSLGVTIMPTGLEDAIGKEEMADILAFIKRTN
jgi:putative membrane-bound dehydrogenase-like protein